MAHNVIPILSSSPPPMEGFDEWGEGEDFGGFESAPCQNAEQTDTPKPKVKVGATNGTTSTEKISPKVDDNGTEPVAEVTSRLNGVTTNAENAVTPGQESVVDSGWGSDGSPLAKSEEFGDFSAGLTVGEEDMTSLNPMSREDSASSSLAGEFKRSGSELVLPDINPGDEDDGEDEDTGINMAASVDSDYRVEFGEGDEWGTLSDSVPESSPEEETIKPFPVSTDSTEPCSETLDTELCNETSTDDQVPTSSHDHNNVTALEITASNLHHVPNTVDGVTDDCSTTDPPPGEVTSSDVTSQSTVTSSEVTSQSTVTSSDVTSQSTVTSSEVTSQSTVKSSDVTSQSAVASSDVTSQSTVASTVTSQSAVTSSDVTSESAVTSSDVRSQSTVTSSNVTSQSTVTSSDVTSQSAVTSSDVTSQSTVASTVTSQSAVASSDVTSQSAVTSEREEDGDWLADIRDEVEEHGESAAVSAASIQAESDDKVVDDDRRATPNVADDPATVADDPATVADDAATVADDAATVADDPATGADDPATVADDPATGADDPATGVADDDDWDPFTEDVDDVTPVADDGWSAFVATETKEDGDWSAFGGSGSPDFGNFGESNTDTNNGAEGTEDDVTETAEVKPEITEVEPETTEMKTETIEVKPETNEMKPETNETEAEIPGAKLETTNSVPEENDDFGNFDEAAEMTSQMDKDGGDDDDEFGDFGGDGDDDDFGDFEEPPPVVANTDSTVISEQSKPLALAKLTEVVAACFPDLTDTEPALEDEDFQEITLDEILEKPRMEEIEKPVQAKKKPENEVIDRNVWSRIMDSERTPPCMKITYRESQIFKQVLQVLEIDPRNILNAKKPSVPVFASNLGLLEPSKPGSEPKPEPLVATTTNASNGGATPDQGETNIPPVEFDWSGAGLTNPLDSSQSGSSLDLDFFIDTTNKPAIQTKSSALENEFLNPIDLPTKKKALTLDSILGNAIFTSVKKDKSENISTEASKLLDKLPDLSFMKAKVLMFPIRSSGNAD